MCRLYIYLFGVLRRFQHCTGHITTGSWKGRGNQYIQLVKVLYCKLPTNGKQLPAVPLEAVLGTEPRPQRWECYHSATVAPLQTLRLVFYNTWISGTSERVFYIFVFLSIFVMQLLWLQTHFYTVGLTTIISFSEAFVILTTTSCNVLRSAQPVLSPTQAMFR